MDFLSPFFLFPFLSFLPRLSLQFSFHFVRVNEYLYMPSLTCGEMIGEKNRKNQEREEHYSSPSNMHVANKVANIYTPIKTHQCTCVSTTKRGHESKNLLLLAPVIIMNELAETRLCQFSLCCTS